MHQGWYTDATDASSCSMNPSPGSFRLVLGFDIEQATIKLVLAWHWTSWCPKICVLMISLPGYC